MRWQEANPQMRQCAALAFAIFGGHFGPPCHTRGVVAVNMDQLMVHCGHKQFHDIQLQHRHHHLQV